MPRPVGGELHWILFFFPFPASGPDGPTPCGMKGKKSPVKYPKGFLLAEFYVVKIRLRRSNTVVDYAE